MIKKLSHATVFVLDQDRAHDFYTQKLGFEVRADVRMGDFRWLTVGPKTQPDMEIILMPVVATPMSSPETVAKLRALVEQGGLGLGVFETDDCKKSYEELLAKGVKFRSPPAERPYGIEAVLQDDSGNWFSMTQRTAR
jgi:catechol 2,3-dioxygenase-like lactoylglutathione lyase family enzyme